MKITTTVQSHEPARIPPQLIVESLIREGKVAAAIVRLKKPVRPTSIPVAAGAAEQAARQLCVSGRITPTRASGTRKHGHAIDPVLMNKALLGLMVNPSEDTQHASRPDVAI